MLFGHPMSVIYFIDAVIFGQEQQVIHFISEHIWICANNIEYTTNCHRCSLWRISNIIQLLKYQSYGKLPERVGCWTNRICNCSKKKTSES